MRSDSLKEMGERPRSRRNFDAAYRKLNLEEDFGKCSFFDMKVNPAETPLPPRTMTETAIKLAKHIRIDRMGANKDLIAPCRALGQDAGNPQPQDDIQYSWHYLK